MVSTKNILLVIVFVCLSSYSASAAQAEPKITAKPFQVALK